ncbi:MULTISPECIES: hypothetical protein [unclassified Enterococcus]|uniref:hypothetical protein n=1 Tax=unclassified Enterococcus TaxID=2608891 RepID=UPI002475D517|nr:MULTISPECIES: hypothetical protein [unclassified Enterococcus]
MLEEFNDLVFKEKQDILEEFDNLSFEEKQDMLEEKFNDPDFVDAYLYGVEGIDNLTLEEKKDFILRQRIEGMVKILKTLEVAKEQRKERFPKLNKFYDRCIEIGWVPPANAIFYGESVEIPKNEDEDLNQFFIDFLTENDYFRLFELLEELEVNLPPGYNEEIKKAIKILKIDMTNFSVLIPMLFSFLDMLCTYQNYRSLDNSKYTNVKEVKALIEERKKLLEESKETLLLIQKNALSVLKEYFRSISFEEPAVFNRNFVQHGRINPSKYSMEDFLKLVSLCNTMGILTYTLRYFDENEKGTNEDF